MTRVRAEAGFTLVEVVLATFLLAVGMLATAAVYDGSRRLTSQAEDTTAMTHRAEAEIERVRALGYAAIAVTAAPAPTTVPAAMRVVSGTGTPALRPSLGDGVVAPEPLMVDASAGAVDAAPRPWSDGRLHGELRTYVTWRRDPDCSAVCPADAGGKRITVVVTPSGGRARAPVVVSTVVTDPNAAPEGVVADGTRNPLRDPQTACAAPDGTLGPCTTAISTASAVSWFLYDTPATAPGWAATPGDHPVHPTVAGGAACVGTTGACPVPDLMGAEPTPAPTDAAALPPLADRSTDVPGAAGTGGRVLRRDVACSATPTASNARSHLWATPPYARTTTLTGDGGLTIHSRTTTGSPADVTLCVRFLSLASATDPAPTALGTVSYRLAAWPGELTAVAFPFSLPGPDLTVAAGRRLGVRVWVADTSAADVVLAYDHPQAPSALQVDVR